MICQSLADLHIIAWLSRVVFLSQGTANPSGLRSLEDQIAGSGVGIGTSGGAKGASGGTGQDWAGGEQTAGTEGASTAAAKPTFQVGKKTRHFWELWIERDSFKRVYDFSFYQSLLRLSLELSTDRRTRLLLGPIDMLRELEEQGPSTQSSHALLYTPIRLRTSKPHVPPALRCLAARDPIPLSPQQSRAPLPSRLSSELLSP